jgi:hypothetical protein
MGITRIRRTPDGRQDHPGVGRRGHDDRVRRMTTPADQRIIDEYTRRHALRAKYERQAQEAWRAAIVLLACTAGVAISHSFFGETPIGSFFIYLGLIVGVGTFFSWLYYTWKALR